MPENKKTPARVIAGFIVCWLLIAAVCCAINPIYVTVSTDIAYSNSLIPLLLTVGSRVSEAVFTGLILALAAAGEYYFRGSRKRLIICRILSLFTAGAMRVVNFIVDGIINGFRDFVLSDYLLTLLVAAVDVLIVMLAIIISRRMIDDKTQRDAALLKASRITGNLFEAEPVIPPKGFFSKTSPVCRAAFTGSAVTYALSFLSDLVTEFGIGMPASADEWLEVAVHYLLIILQWMLCYAVARLFFGFRRKTAD